MLRIAPRMAHMCVIVEKNFVIRAVARFVAYSMNITQVSFYETEAEATRCRQAVTRLTQDGVVADILRHLAEIGAGRTSITEADLANAPTDVMRELLVGLLTLHEDLQYERGLRAVAEQQSDRLVADLREAVAARDEFLSVASHELRTPLSTLRLQTTALSRWLSQSANLGRPGRTWRGMSRSSTGRSPGWRSSPRRCSTSAASGRDASNSIVRSSISVDLVGRSSTGSTPTRRRRTGRRVRGAASVVGEWDPFRIDQVASNLIVERHPLRRR